MQAFSKHNKGIKYLLTIIDVFSKFVWIILVKQKTGHEIANAFLKISAERKPTKMWVDKGREFYNKDERKLVALFYRKRRKILCY